MNNDLFSWTIKLVTIVINKLICFWNLAERLYSQTSRALTHGAIYCWLGCTISRSQTFPVGLSSIINRTKLRLVHNQKGNYQHDHILSNLKEIRNLFFSNCSGLRYIYIYIIREFYNQLYICILYAYIYITSYIGNIFAYFLRIIVEDLNRLNIFIKYII